MCLWHCWLMADCCLKENIKCHPSYISFILWKFYSFLFYNEEKRQWGITLPSFICGGGCLVRTSPYSALQAACLKKRWQELPSWIRSHSTFHLYQCLACPWPNHDDIWRYRIYQWQITKGGDSHQICLAPSLQSATNASHSDSAMHNCCGNWKHVTSGFIYRSALLQGSSQLLLVEGSLPLWTCPVH